MDQHLPNEIKIEFIRRVDTFMALSLEFQMCFLENQDAQKYGDLYNRFKDFKKQLDTVQNKAA